MNKLNKVQIDYVSEIAGEQVSDDCAIDFLRGLDDFDKPVTTYVDYDILKQGYIVTKTLRCNSFESAMRVVRKLNQIALTKPIVYQKGD